MRNVSLSKGKRITAGVLGLVMLLALLFFAVFIAAEAEHDCTGEDCPICAAIAACARLLDQLRGCVAFREALAPLLFFALSAVLFTWAGALKTPVSNKVRLNN